MTGRRSYAFEIAMRARDGSWQVVAARSGTFSRPPKATARSIAERWIHEQAGQLRGGRLVVLGKRRTPPRRFDASVRVRILDRLDGYLLAAAYVGVDRDQDRVGSPFGGHDEYLPAALARAGGDRG
ncbi:hypothetical protein [Kribbella sp. NPDC049227]|uniref:hypothetical protein n=1 Tax=Kribbella sp. NPDC049227 TaxID=3364113 RepID=UPI00371F8D58